MKYAPIDDRQFLVDLDDVLRAENQRLRDALEKYADNSNWLYDTEYCIYEWQGEADNPASLAQEALKKTE